MNIESTGATSTAGTERGDFAKADARLDEIKGMNMGDMSDDDLENVMEERKALRAQKEEMMGTAQMEATAESQIRKTYDGAHEMNRGIDEAEQKRAEAEKVVAEAAEQAKQAEEKVARRQVELAQADALLAEIKGGTPVSEVVAVGIAGAVVAEKILEQNKKSPEDVYGMSIGDLRELMGKDANERGTQQAEVKLFDRVLSGEATEVLVLTHVSSVGI